MKRYNKQNKLVQELFPDMEYIKKGNQYNILVFGDEEGEARRVCVTRQGSVGHRVKMAFLLPFIFIPFCFWYGFRTVKAAVYSSFKAELITHQTFDEEEIKKVEDALNVHDNDK